SSEVNEAVFGLMTEGRVTSATLLANGHAVTEAARRARDLPERSFGAHLNLSEFPPLTQQPGLKPLLDAQGCFAGNRLRQIPITPSLKEAVFEELTAQVGRLQALGVRLSHLD